MGRSSDATTSARHHLSDDDAYFMAQYQKIISKVREPSSRAATAGPLLPALLSLNFLKPAGAIHRQQTSDQNPPRLESMLLHANFCLFDRVENAFMQSVWRRNADTMFDSKHYADPLLLHVATICMRRQKSKSLLARSLLPMIQCCDHYKLITQSCRDNDITHSMPCRAHNFIGYWLVLLMLNCAP